MCLSVVSEVEPYAVRIARTVPGGARNARCAPTRQNGCDLQPNDQLNAWRRLSCCRNWWYFPHPRNTSSAAFTRILVPPSSAKGLSLSLPEFRAKPRHNSMVRPDSCGPLGLQPLTYEGETAHEADGITVGFGSQPFPNLSLPECLTRGLQQCGKPAIRPDLPSNSDSAPGVGRRSGSAKANCVGSSIVTS